MKKLNYTGRAFFTLLISFFIVGMCEAQTKEDLKGIPIEESGISVAEYDNILKHESVDLSPTKERLTLTLCKVYGNTNDPKMKHIFIPKDNPNKPQWSAIPYTILREEDYDENN